MKKILLSPSYLTTPLILLLFINRKYASYFYPYVVSCVIRYNNKTIIIFDKKKKFMVKIISFKYYKFIYRYIFNISINIYNNYKNNNNIYMAL